ncbi:MAG: hypothetical protein AAF493_11945 [Pseudomonadota bacterium]
MIRVLLIFIGAVWPLLTSADDVQIVGVVFQKTGPTTWRVDTTLKHADTGWEHYADAWRVVGTDGSELAVRILYHPHVEEQPFTRSVSATIAESVTEVVVEARDKVHGWSADRVSVNLNQPKGDRFTVNR